MHARHTDDVGSFFKVVFSALAMVILGLWSLIYKALESKRERERLQMVSYKYSGEIAAMINRKNFWRGQTAEQLRNSLGSPDSVDVKLLKTKRREI